MKLINFFSIIILQSLVFTGFSQRVVFFQNHADKRYEKVDGANRGAFSWIQLTLLGTDLTPGNTDSKQDFSNYYALTWNHKFKINRTFSHGLGYGLHRQVYRLSEKGLKTLQHEAWEKGKLIFWGVNAHYFWRFNFDPKRGNILGKYLDLAAFGQFNFVQRAKFVDGTLTEKKGSGTYTERFATGVELRLGRELLSLYVRYKLTSTPRDASKPTTNLDLAKWSVGLNLGFGT